MCPEDDMPLSDEDKKKAIENFMEVYTSTYRDYLGKKDVDERHLPLMYKGFPFIVEAYLHPNQSVTIILKKSNRSRILVVEGEFEEVRNMLSERNFDFMQTFPPYTQWTEDEAERISKLDAERDLAGSRRLELLGGIEGHMDDILEESNNILQLNPWLDEQSKAQTEKVEKARALILELYREMETDENERFARYERELMEIEAFEKMEMEAVASEMEMEVETAVSEIEEQFGDLEGEFGELEGEFQELRDALNDSIDSLRKKMQEALLRIDSMEAAAESEDLMDDMKELREANRKMNTSVRKSEKEIRDLKKNLTISEEIKDTVFRDSKRIHNLNERTTDLEKDVQNLAASKPKKLEAEVKALVKRLDKMDRDMNKMIRKAVDFEFETRKPVVVEAPPPSDSAPKGATVKKTTKKKTTKKTKKKAS